MTAGGIHRRSGRACSLGIDGKLEQATWKRMLFRREMLYRQLGRMQMPKAEGAKVLEKNAKVEIFRLVWSKSRPSGRLIQWVAMS